MSKAETGGRRKHPEQNPLSLTQSIGVAVLVLLAAGLTVDLVLWPRDELPSVTALDPVDWFSDAAIDRADAFRGPQTWLLAAATLLPLLVAMAVAAFWPRGLQPGERGSLRDRLVDRRGGLLIGRGGPLLFALTAAVVVALGALVALVPALIAHGRAQDVGLALQSTTDWIGERLLALALLLIATVVLSLLAYLLIRRVGRMWWIPFALCLVLLATVWTFASPVVVEPLFGEFSELPAGPLRDEVETLAEHAGVQTGDVLTVDAARRTTGANAYVSGLGGTRRVVLWDTLVDGFPAAERRQVIAHELAHARENDVVAGLLWFAFIALAATFAADLIARAVTQRLGADFGSPPSAAALLAAGLFCVLLIQPAANAWSRAVEARADAVALQITAEPEATIALERRLTVENVSRPRPPALAQLLFGTHPAPIDRIGMAETVRRELKGEPTGATGATGGTAASPDLR